MKIFFINCGSPYYFSPPRDRLEKRPSWGETTKAQRTERARQIRSLKSITQTIREPQKFGRN